MARDPVTAYTAPGTGGHTTGGPLDEAQRCACALLADLLRSARLWDGPALLGLAAAGLSGTAWPPMPHAALMFMLGGLLAVERYLAVRVALDARLFDRLARGAAPGGVASLALLDQALMAQLGMPAPQASRTLLPRLAGARRLYRLHLAAALSCTAQAGWMLLNNINF